MRRVTFATLLVLAFSMPGFAQSDARPELRTRYEYYYATYRLNADASHVETHEYAMKVLKEAALEGAKRAHVTYSTSVQQAEILEAYTRKADGRRIEVPKSNYQVETNRGHEDGSPAFSDLTTLTIVFPELVVGDAMVLSYKIVQREPMFPGHFSMHGVFPKQYPYDDVKITIDAPESLWAQHEVREMAETIRTQEGRKIIELRWRNPEPIESKRKDYSVYDIEKEPGYAYSTFRTYRDIAEAYGARARPKAAVTERIRQLADEIVKDEQAPREQARALYDWVATNITYAGNCVGTGAVVPHDLHFVLENRMGDCKDHATLLQALLAAKGIQSTQALINAGSSYRLPKIPVVSTVNHVITYIPALDLYADSTSDSTPFGMLPFASADKPVLLVDGFKEGARTPHLPPGANRQRMTSLVRIASDGSATGETRIDLKGMFAADARARFRELQAQHEDEMVQNVFKRGGYLGTGKLDKEDPTALTDSYAYGVKFELKQFLRRPGAGAFYVYPLFFSEAPVYHFSAQAMQEPENVDVACSDGISVEEYIYEFPADMKILAVPENVSLSNEVAAYRASYRLEGQTLKVQRTFEDRSPGNVCSPAAMRAYNDLASKAMEDGKAQIVYR
jgi:hypothetical protein